MSAATRLGDKTIGHCFFPTPSIQASFNVFINGRGAVRIGDSYLPHRCGKKVHQGKLARGSRKVFINGRAAGRVGDQLSCGDTVAVGSTNVFIGG